MAVLPARPLPEQKTWSAPPDDQYAARGIRTMVDRWQPTECAMKEVGAGDGRARAANPQLALASQGAIVSG